MGLVSHHTSGRTAINHYRTYRYISQNIIILIILSGCSMVSLDKRTIDIPDNKIFCTNGDSDIRIDKDKIRLRCTLII